MILTPLLYFLPNATLAATIIVAVLSLVDLGGLKRTHVYSVADFLAMAGTTILTLVEGVEAGLLVGVGLSIFLHLYSTSRPHIAVVGQNSRNCTFPQRRAPYRRDRSGDSVATSR
jgi:sulfate permease, SulP family